MQTKKLLPLLFIFCSTSILKGQETDGINLVPGIKYEIGGIQVTGVDNLDPTVIQLLSGLTVGDQITVPGDKLASAVRKLWEQKLFADIQIVVAQKTGNVIFLEYRLVGLPRMARYYFTGISRSKQNDLREILGLKQGTIITENLIVSTENKVKKYYRSKGYLNGSAVVSVEGNPKNPDEATLAIAVDRGERVKISDINFIGNKEVSSRKLRRAMDETHRHRWYNIFRSSKYIEDLYEADLRLIIDEYNKRGYRDARIVKDTMYFVSPDRLQLDITIEEGPKYYFRDITFLGNSKYSSALLSQVLQIKKGDVYDSELLNERVQFDPDGNDIASIYLDNGYLFSSVTPIEVQVEGDSIDIEIRIREGRQATVNKVTVVGNDRTNDHVIYRELRTRPGDLFSRSDIQRTMRELAQLTYFDQTQLGVVPTPNPETGTVDIEYSVVEQSTSQLELQGGWGGGYIIGTLGLSFNNFSARNIFNADAWSPLPAGDGQSINLRAQASGAYFQSYSASFTEPWLGGKKPTSLTVSVYHNINRYPYGSFPVNMAITGVNAGLGTRLKWPDDYFVAYGAAEFRVINSINSQFLPDGVSKNINISGSLRRDNRDVPIFPTRGSNFQFSLELTPPFSQMQSIFPGVNEENKYEYIEYHKWKFSSEWFTQLAKNLVLKGEAEFGFLGSYSDEYGLPPFERFYMGGDGLQNFQLDGREIIRFRGYPNSSLSSQAGDPIYNRFTLELRYLISPNPQATIFALVFADAGDSYQSFTEYRPFQLKRSAGFGVRIFMPMFGMLGVDLGYGLDPIGNMGEPSGWQTHFMIGQQF